jgi:hypothetical protein
MVVSATGMHHSGYHVPVVAGDIFLVVGVGIKLS